MIRALSLFGVLLAAPSTFVKPEALSPSVKTGEHLNSVFSKTVAITGAEFDPIVKRISGSASDSIVAVTPNEIVEDESYLYDGRQPGRDRVSVRDGGATNCVDSKCAPNDQTSAPLFDPLLWGRPPRDLKVGLTWQTEVKAPWEIGPPGKERISVLRFDPALGLVTLRREGSGEGLSSDDQRSVKVTVVSHGQSMEAQVEPGAATWVGTATFLRGVTLADEIVLTRHVRLMAANGRIFQGVERIYTLFMEA